MSPEVEFIRALSADLALEILASRIAGPHCAIRFGHGFGIKDGLAKKRSLPLASGIQDHLRFLG